jgi:hypothetical protein
MDNNYENEFEGCQLVIQERVKSFGINNTTSIYYTYKYFDLIDKTDVTINYEFDPVKIMNQDYNFSITYPRSHKEIFNTNWNNSEYDFVNAISNYNMSDSEITEIINEMKFQYIILNKPFRLNSEENVYLYDITIEYKVEVDMQYIAQVGISKIKVEFHSERWLAALKHNDMGKIYKITDCIVPEYIRNEVTGYPNNNSDYNILWYYPYYNGDIYLVNLRTHKMAKTQFEYFIAVHLHIEKNLAGGKCHEHCVSKWKSNEISQLQEFLLENSYYMTVTHSKGTTYIMFNNSVCISQDIDCCYVNKKMIMAETD